MLSATLVTTKKTQGMHESWSPKMTIDKTYIQHAPILLPRRHSFRHAFKHALRTTGFLHVRDGGFDHYGIGRAAFAVAAAGAAFAGAAALRSAARDLTRGRGGVFIDSDTPPSQGTGRSCSLKSTPWVAMSRIARATSSPYTRTRARQTGSAGQWHGWTCPCVVLFRHQGPLGNRCSTRSPSASSKTVQAT